MYDFITQLIDVKIVNLIVYTSIPTGKNMYNNKPSTFLIENDDKILEVETQFENMSFIRIARIHTLQYKSNCT